MSSLKKIYGATVNSVVKNAKETVFTMGKNALHSLSPDNFEYYMCSFELTDSVGETKGYISFAVMPNSITETKSQIASITKTNGGITTLFNDSFVPRDISLQGTFGRKFRLLTGMKEAENVSTIPFFNGNLGFNFADNDVMVKTGYGLTKMLKNIIDTSFTLDDKNNPCILYFHNYAFNTHYVVEVMQSSFSQSVENNMLWYYNIEMKAVAEATRILTEKEANGKAIGNINANAIGRGINNILTDVSRVTLGSLNIGL